jgi:hypothetical protein
LVALERHWRAGARQKIVTVSPAAPAEAVAAEAATLQLGSPVDAPAPGQDPQVEARSSEQQEMG